MPSPNLNDLLTGLQTDVDLVHQFVKGDATVVITAPNGTYPSLAKIASDALITITGVNTSLAEARVLINSAIAAGQASITTLISNGNTDINLLISTSQTAINNFLATSQTAVNTLIAQIQAAAATNDAVLNTTVSNVANLTIRISKEENISISSIINNTANNLLFGQPVVCLSNNSALLASSDNINLKNVYGFVTDTILTNAGVGNIRLFGKLIGTTGQWGMVVDGGLVPNTKYFLDIAAGKMTSTPPVNGYCCILGKALSTTEFFINIEKPIAF